MRSRAPNRFGEGRCAALSTQTIFFVLEWTIRISALFYVPLRKSPAAAASWLLLIVMLPVPGVLLFLAIGRARMPRWRTERFERLAGVQTALASRLRQTQPPRTDLAPIAHVAETIGRQPPTGGNGVEILVDYQESIDRLIADIDNARNTVHLLAYLFADDRTGTAVVDALGRAVGRGVTCRVLIDPVGSNRWFRRVQRKLHGAGVQVRTALPLRPLHRWTRRDIRNHRKLCLIDGEIGHIGSQNLVNANFRKDIVNRELVARLAGPVVAALEAVFANDWYLETQENLYAAIRVPEAAGQDTIQAAPSGPDYGDDTGRSLILSLIGTARVRITIVTPYLIPDEAVMGALKLAALRGVNVELIVSKVTDHPLVRLAQSSYYAELMAIGVNLLMFESGLLHAKTVLVDGRIALVGSCNLDIRSLSLNDELSVVFHGGQAVADTASAIDAFLAKSEPVDAARWRERRLERRLAENIARLASPLL